MKTSQVRAALALLQWDVERLALAADIDPNRLKVMLATQGEFTSLKIDGEYITDGLHAEMKIHKALTLRGRSEEHTSELQSLMRISYAVFCLKKKKTKHTIITLQVK